MMIGVVLMYITVLSLMGSAATIVAMQQLQLVAQYKNTVQELYRHEGIIERAIWGLKAGEDRDMNGVEDFEQLHGNNDSVGFYDDNHIVLIERHPTEPHLAIIKVGNVEVTINSFPGGGESCQHSPQCHAKRVAWRSI